MEINLIWMSGPVLLFPVVRGGVHLTVSSTIVVPGFTYRMIHVVILQHTHQMSLWLVVVGVTMVDNFNGLNFDPSITEQAEGSRNVSNVNFTITLNRDRTPKSFILIISINVVRISSHGCFLLRRSNQRLVPCLSHPTGVHDMFLQSFDNLDEWANWILHIFKSRRIDQLSECRNIEWIVQLAFFEKSMRFLSNSLMYVYFRKESHF